jgi:Leucine-rich repeat (LRR) protein
LSNLQGFYCHTNQLTGSIPSLTGLSNLRYFYCNNQLGTTKLTGSIPSLSGLSNLQSFDCTLNQLTSFAGGSVSATLGDFRANVNLLSASAVNAILAAFVAANKTTGTRVLNLGGTGNAAPTGQGLTDVTTLRNRGWSVTTN